MPTEIKLSFKPDEDGGEYLSSANFTGDVKKKYNIQSPGLLYEFKDGITIYHSELQVWFELAKCVENGDTINVQGSKKSGVAAKEYISGKVVEYMKAHPLDEMASDLEVIITALNKDGSKIDNRDMDFLENLTLSYNLVYNQLANDKGVIEKDVCKNDCPKVILTDEEIDKAKAIKAEFGLVLNSIERDNATDDIEIISLKNGASLGYIAGLNIKTTSSVKR